MRSFRRALLRVILIGLGLTVGLLGLAGGVAWWVATHPERAYEIGRRYILPSDLKVVWGDVHFRPRRITWLHWAVDLRIDDLLVEKGSPQIRAPIDEISLRFEAQAGRGKTRADFAQVTVRAAKPIQFTTSPEEATKDEGQSPFEMLRTYLEYLNVGARYASVQNLDVDIKEFRLVQMKDVLKVNARILKPSPGLGADAIGITAGAQSRALRLAIGGTLEPTNFGTEGEPVLRSTVEFEGFGVKESGDIAVGFHDEKVQLKFDGSVDYNAGGTRLKFKPELRAIIDETHADIRLKTPVAGLPKPMGRVDPLEVHLEMPIESGRTFARAPSKVSAAAPLDLFFVDAPLKADLERECKCKIPPRLAVALNGTVWLDTLTSAPATRRPAADLRLEVQSLKNSLFTIDLAANAKAFREKDAWTFEPHLDSEAHLLSYGVIRKMLDARGVLIPAPFDALDGIIDVVAKDDVRQDEGASLTKVDVKVALGSAHQRVDVRSKVDLKLAKNFRTLDVFVKILIDLFQIQLPPLEPLAGLPPLAHDARVMLTPPAPPKPIAPAKKAGDAFKVQMFFSLETVHPGAIRLLSALAKPHVPISVAVDRALNGDLTGNVQLEPFAITYLRRTVHVEHLRVVMDERDPANFPVDGRFRVEQTQYKIFVDVSGTVRSPSIRLSSEPYLPRNEIISVLLYDRTSHELAAGDAETAGSFEAAVADRAIGLFGLWAFASTPIKSFSYNPVTKVYSATVQLADGLTAGVGTNWEEAASFEVRKRVSRRWVLTASWSPSEVSSNQVGRLVLQWEKRF